jgi:uncharacterized protein
MFRTKNSGLPLDIKAVGDDGVVEGYASVFGAVDSYNEMVAPGAFKGSLATAKREKRKIKMLWQHDTFQPIGVWDDLTEDEKGLLVRGRILKDVSAQAAEAFGLIKEGALDELSIGYREIETAPDRAQDGVTVLKKLDLREVSVVTFGALGVQARIHDVKSIREGGGMPSLDDFDELLREAGFSKTQRSVIAGKGYLHLLRGEPGTADEQAIELLRALAS